MDNKLNLIVNREVKTMYIGLIEGTPTIKDNWDYSIADSSLTATKEISVISILDITNGRCVNYEFLELEDSSTIELNSDNMMDIYDYFIYGSPLK